MKSGDKPQFVKKWWMSEKPPEIKGVDLEKALASFEKARADEEGKGDAKSIDNCSAALRDVGGAVDKTIKKEFDKKQHKECISVLEKFDDLIKSELKRLGDKKAALAATGAQNKAEGADDDEDEGKLFEPDYLYKMIKILRSGKDLNFGFGLNKETPEASRLLLARKGKPEKLFRELKQTGQFSNRLLICGVASPDSADAKVLIFRVQEGENEPPQLLKLGRRFLKADKNLRFRKLKLILPGGQTFEDTEPDTDDDSAVAADQTTGVSGGGAKEFGDAITALEKQLQQFLDDHQLAI